MANTEQLIDQTKGQYDTEQARAFYHEVMGGGGGNIHYGIYRSEKDTVLEAADESCRFLAAQLDLQVPLQGKKVVDFGSGTGAAAIKLCKEYGCKVTGFNLCPEQNADAEKEAAKVGVGALFNAIEGNFDTPFPADLAPESYDAAWSQEAFCHSADKAALLKKIAAVLKPGGVLGFTDIMAGEAATAEQLRTFTDRNATSEMARASDYFAYLGEAGLEVVSVSDMTRHLPKFFAQMADNIDAKKDELQKLGVAEDYMLNFQNSLRDRVGYAHDGCFGWSFIVARKPESAGEAKSGLPAKFAVMHEGGKLATSAISGRATD